MFIVPRELDIGLSSLSVAGQCCCNLSLEITNCDQLVSEIKLHLDSHKQHGSGSWDSLNWIMESLNLDNGISLSGS